MRPSARIAFFAAWIALCALAACAKPQEKLVVADPDAAAFATLVYPVLLRDCGFHTCHGNTERFFQVVGPGRLRLDPQAFPLDEVTDDEIAHTRNRARSMVDAVNPAQSLLLRKPLSREAGGASHEGVDHFGRDVYPATNAPGYLAIEQWVRSLPTVSQ